MSGSATMSVTPCRGFTYVTFAVLQVRILVLFSVRVQNRREVFTDVRIVMGLWVIPGANTIIDNFTSHISDLIKVLKDLIRKEIPS